MQILKSTKHVRTAKNWKTLNELRFNADVQKCFFNANTFLLSYCFTNLRVD